MLVVPHRGHWHRPPGAAKPSEVPATAPAAPAILSGGAATRTPTRPEMWLRAAGDSCSSSPATASSGPPTINPSAGHFVSARSSCSAARRKWIRAASSVWYSKLPSSIEASTARGSASERPSISVSWPSLSWKTQPSAVDKGHHRSLPTVEDRGQLGGARSEAEAGRVAYRSSQRDGHEPPCPAAGERGHTPGRAPVQIACKPAPHALHVGLHGVE